MESIGVDLLNFLPLLLLNYVEHNGPLHSLNYQDQNHKIVDCLINKHLWVEVEAWIPHVLLGMLILYISLSWIFAKLLECLAQLDFLEEFRWEKEDDHYVNSVYNNQHEDDLNDSCYY